MRGAAALATCALCWIAQGVAASCPPPSDGQVEIYPTASVLPENLLRIYIYYPRPMAVEEGVRHVHLLDEDGAALDGVFLVNRDDLWSPDRRRLTLLLDPGRVKTGLDANEALGRALVAGRSYTLTVSGDARDSADCPLGTTASHVFTAGPADLAPPDPSAWDVSTPRVHSDDAVVVDLGSPHDHLSLAFRLRVLDGEGSLVPGAIALGAAEQSWEFTPRHPWTGEPYSIAIGESLEDLAGNRPGLLFDRPLDQDPEPWERALGFTPAP